MHSRILAERTAVAQARTMAAVAVIAADLGVDAPPFGSRPVGHVDEATKQLFERERVADFLEAIANRINPDALPEPARVEVPQPSAPQVDPDPALRQQIIEEAGAPQEIRHGHPLPAPQTGPAEGAVAPVVADTPPTAEQAEAQGRGPAAQLTVDPASEIPGTLEQTTEDPLALARSVVSAAAQEHNALTEPTPAAVEEAPPAQPALAPLAPIQTGKGKGK